jgi:hypothetical protein
MPARSLRDRVLAMRAGYDGRKCCDCPERFHFVLSLLMVKLALDLELDEV